MLQVTGEEYRRAGPFRQIAPMDMTPKARVEYSRIKDKERRRAKRRMQGVTSRQEYLRAHNFSRTKPWLALGMSRRTWERKRTLGQITNSSDASLVEINLSENDALASARAAVEQREEKEARKVSLSGFRSATDTRLLEELRHEEMRRQLENVPAPPCKPGGIRERAWLAARARYAAAMEAEAA
jgi:hypothetical protein